MAASSSVRYDVIICGAGAAGLSLAYHLCGNPAGNKLKVLLIDEDPKLANDRTWGYWAAQTQPFDELAQLSFSQVEFISRGYSNTLSIAPYTYRVIRSSDFYAFVKGELAKCPNVEWRYARVLNHWQEGEQAVVSTEEEEFRSRWVFSSLFLGEKLAQARQTHTVLRQHFKGWVIKTPDPSFRADRLRMFDFRTPQIDSLRFFYLIPYSEREALVEYTLFSENLLSPSEYSQALQMYVEGVLGLKSYEIGEEEWGEIPMTTYPFPRAASRIIPIGSAGGASKASTGYTFARIQRQTRHLAACLLAGKTLEPFFGVNRFTVYDQALLNILAKRGIRGEEVFTALFKNNPPRRLLRFLDEETSVAEELKIMLSVPQGLFINSLANHYLGLPFLAQ